MELKVSLDSKVKHIDSNRIIEEYNVKPVLENMNSMIDKFRGFILLQNESSFG